MKAALTQKKSQWLLLSLFILVGIGTGFGAQKASALDGDVSYPGPIAVTANQDTYVAAYVDPDKAGKDISIDLTTKCTSGFSDANGKSDGQQITASIENGGSQ